ncbi:MAG TPA: 1-acyl-sn-glycerol-3-phosphate acyltransferase, partial [Chitinophagaceae bacterium]|nr:1-acyl-sn-glycerol-3-phosphate acyltransferase [Chitinophagaceae bacterium]
MLYQFLKVTIRLAMFIFCRKVIINKREMLRSKGPLLLACNHPNSFLDSIILDTLMQQPVWALARGDAFKNGFISRILASLKILPVYRTSEGVENLTENYRTFSDCVNIFRHKGV